MTRYRLTMAAAVVALLVIAVAGYKAYERQKARCSRLGGRVVSVTSYGTTWVPGGYVNGKYVPGGSVSSSQTTTNCIDRRDGHLIFGM